MNTHLLHAVRFITLYIPLVIVGMIAIRIGTHVPWMEALVTAAASCFFKTVVSHIHHDLWKAATK